MASPSCRSCRSDRGSIRHLCWCSWRSAAACWWFRIFSCNGARFLRPRRRRLTSPGVPMAWSRRRLRSSGGYIGLMPLFGFRIATALYRRPVPARAGTSRVGRPVGAAGGACRRHSRDRLLRIRTLSVRCCFRAAAGPAGSHDDARAARRRNRQRPALEVLLPLFLGTLAGVIGGSLPGVTITMTVIVILPFTYGLDPLAGLAAMTGVYVGGSSGGLITACLLGIPGTPSAIATTFDGFPMARNGEPGRAIWLGVWASVLGRPAGGVVPDLSHGAAGRDRAGVWTLGVFLAVRSGDGDGGGVDGSPHC